ncbi:ribose 5-phosphate isomerase B [Candidatus Peregrinibacteria bacterium CG_4_9_14_0_2_um_filter_53_11]|nr:MAG: ribose 5-phosphate isomerase B [Candidatus Peregrinibacteria bacterium CG_4_9_14_0_2_um_filter_53_11]
MTLYLGSDHAGLELKKILQAHLESKGYKTVDLGAFAVEPPTDYPRIAHEVGEKVRENHGARGILICGTGLGMCMAANKVKHIRAAVCESEQTVEMSRKHNDANVLCLGGRVLQPDLAQRMVDVFMETPFEGEERHIRRVENIELNDA